MLLLINVLKHLYTDFDQFTLFYGKNEQILIWWLEWESLTLVLTSVQIATTSWAILSHNWYYGFLTIDWEKNGWLCTWLVLQKTPSFQCPIKLYSENPSANWQSFAPKNNHYTGPKIPKQSSGTSTPRTVYFRKRETRSASGLSNGQHLADVIWRVSKLSTSLVTNYKIDRDLHYINSDKWFNLKN